MFCPIPSAKPFENSSAATPFAYYDMIRTQTRAGCTGLFLYAHMAQRQLSVRQKSRQPLTRLPADRMNTVIWFFWRSKPPLVTCAVKIGFINGGSIVSLNQDLPGAPAAKSAFGYLCCKDKVHQRRVGSFAKSEFACLFISCSAKGVFPHLLFFHLL